MCEESGVGKPEDGRKWSSGHGGVSWSNFPGDLQREAVGMEADTLGEYGVWRVKDEGIPPPVYMVSTLPPARLGRRGPAL